MASRPAPFGKIILRLLALICALAALALFAVRFLPRLMALGLARHLLGRDGAHLLFADTPELTFKATVLLMPLEVVILIVVVLCAWIICSTATRDSKRYLMHVSWWAFILFGAWVGMVLFHLRLTRGIMEIPQIVCDQVGGIVLESLLAAAAAVCACFGWKAKSKDEL
jgi:hypothetical protein